MIKIIKIIYVRMISQHTINIFMMIMVFFTLFFTISILYNNHQSKSKFFKNYSDKAYYISNVFENYQYDFIDFVNTLNETSLNQVIGYELINRTYTILNKKIMTVYINEYLQRFEYHLIEGNWFQKNKSDEVIIGGGLSSRYQIGDTIALEIGTVIAELKVIGKLPNEYNFMFLNVAGDELTYEKITTTSQEDILLTNDAGILTASNETYMNHLSFVVDGDYLLNDLLTYPSDQVISIQEIQKNADLFQFSTMYIQNTAISILILVIILFYILYDTYIHTHETFIITNILRELGINTYQLSFMLCCPRILNITISFVVVLFYQILFPYQDRQVIILASMVQMLFIMISIFAAYGLSYALVRNYPCKKKEI